MSPDILCVTPADRAGLLPVVTGHVPVPSGGPFPIPWPLSHFCPFTLLSPEA